MSKTQDFKIEEEDFFRHTHAYKPVLDMVKLREQIFGLKTGQRPLN